MSGGPPDVHPDASSASPAKLSIRHLMIWGACVAIYCSAYQSIERVAPPLIPFRKVFFAGNAALLFFPVQMLVLGIAHFYAIPRSENGRWKAVFVIIPVSLIAIIVLVSLAAIGSPVATVGRWFVAAFVAYTLLVFAAVAVAALIDLRQTQRYPWTHWAGILLFCWQVTVYGQKP
jgi:hypothetical protein